MSAPVYYQVVGGEALEFCRDFRERRSAVRDVAFEWAKAKGAEAVMEAWGKVWGLIFPHNFAIPTGWKAERKKASDGSTIHTPAMRTEAGRALSAEMKALLVEPSPQEFASKFGVPTQLQYRRSETNYGACSLTSSFPYTSFIAWTDAGDSFWVLLPDIDTLIAEHSADGQTCEPSSWTVPNGIVRSTRARYDLAVAQAAVAEEGAPA